MYNDRNRLAELTRSGPQQAKVTFAYDPDGNMTGDGSTTHYIRGNARLTASDSEKARTYYHYVSDRQGSVRYVDPSGHCKKQCKQNVVEIPGKVGGSQTRKPINRPSSKKVKIDMEEVISGHTSGGQRAKQSQIKDLFSDRMNSNAIEKEIRRAYGNAKQVGSPQFDGVNTRIKLQGKGKNGVIEMWFNKLTQTIETAYPIYGKKVKIE